MIHKVQQGDHISSIAQRYGFGSPATIWNAEENKDLRNRRENPHALFPGDEIFIPERKTTTFTRSTGAEHRFTVFLPSLKIQVKLLDWFGAPRHNMAVTVTVNGKKQDLTTSSDGLLTFEAPASARAATVDCEGGHLTLAIGDLDPVATVSGAGARLRNLGDYPFEKDAADTDRARLRFALELFADDASLTMTRGGEESFAEKMRTEHGA